MATMVHATEPVDHPTWEIQRDAFVPPPTRRIVRGWDRAPVSARAPRLYGQKVWKKVGPKTTTVEDIQNEAKEELEKEGAGARKKLRMLTSRENINDAMWAEVIPDEREKDMGTTLGPSGKQSENLNIAAAPATDDSNAGIQIFLSHDNNAPNEEKQDAAMAILQFIPRKRTNTDHVITPKKPSRQTTLDNKEQTSSVNEKLNSVKAKNMRPRKSLRRSMVPSMSDNASEPTKTSKAQTRHSSSTERLLSLEGVTSVGKKSEAPVGESIGNRRVLRRSTISTRRSIVHAEQTSEIGHTALESTDLGPQDTTKPIISIPANSTISEDVLQIVLDELPVTGNTTVCDITGRDPNLPSETTPEFKPSACLLTPTDSQLLEAMELKLRENSANSGKDIEQTQVARIEGDIYVSQEQRQGQSIDISGIQSSLSELQKPASCAIIEEQLVIYQDMSKAYRGALEEHTNSPVHTRIASSLESGYEVLQAESIVSSPAELDVRESIQNAEAPEVHDSSNLTTAYDYDDTDMLRKFLTRVKANKAAKNPPKRKRSLPHSPLRIPLGDLDNNASPSPLQPQKADELGVVEPSPSKRKKKPSALVQCENEPEPRRSSRTKPPIKEPPGAPSFIPVRRLGQDIDTTVTLKRSEEKELAALTRVNTRKNKGNALTALEVLAKKSEEKEDPVMRQRLLKEVFDEKMEKSRQDKEKKGREKKSVTWAEELAQFQIFTKGKSGGSNDDKENEKVIVVQSAEEKKQGAVRVGVRSKAALGMALNGTPAPKRKMRGRV